MTVCYASDDKNVLDKPDTDELWLRHQSILGGGTEATSP
jgi:hypothetical protein